MRTRNCDTLQLFSDTCERGAYPYQRQRFTLDGVLSMSSMMPDQSIRRELSLSEVVSRTFELFRRDFAKYFVLFAIVQTIVGVATALASSYFVLQSLPSNPTPQQF